MADRIYPPDSMREEAAKAALRAAFAEISVGKDTEGIADILKAFAAVRRVEKEYNDQWSKMTDVHEGKKPDELHLHFEDHIVASAILAKSDFFPDCGDIEDMHPYNATSYHFARMCHAVVALEALATAEIANDCEFYSARHAENALKIMPESEGHNALGD